MSDFKYQVNLSDYSKPYIYMRYSANLSIILDIMSTILIASALIISSFYISEDIQQGQNYKIMYIHVPSAWVSLLTYVVLSICSALYLVYKHPILYLISKSLALTGTIFTAITLITGSMWGLPVWGTYWVWDARLTSMLILFLFYLTYLIFNTSFDNQAEAAKAASILTLVGLINIPIVKFSVEWWNTLHQPSSITQTTSSIDLSMSIMLLLVFIAFLLISLSRILILVRKEIIVKKTDSLNYKE